MVVLVLSMLVLLLAFRSLAVPLQAAVTNVLCVAAAFGVMTALFQWGWGIDLLHIDTSRDTVPIASYVPLMMFAVLFGLSMDYQVFLLSQVDQHRVAGEGDAAAVRSGLAVAAKVITAAALIMIFVFGSFILNGDPTVKQFGVGLAVAVALAASMVLLLAPAVLVLMGRGHLVAPALAGADPAAHRHRGRQARGAGPGARGPGGRGPGRPVSTPGLPPNRSIPAAEVIPVLVYEDVGAAVDWLCAAFDFALRWRAGGHRAQLVHGEGAVVVTEPGDGRGSVAPDGHSVLVRVADADAHHERAARHGARIVAPPADQPYGERQYTAEDPAGRRWTFSQTIADVAPEEWGGVSGPALSP